MLLKRWALRVPLLFFACWMVATNTPHDYIMNPVYILGVAIYAYQWGRYDAEKGAPKIWT